MHALPPVPALPTALPLPHPKLRAVLSAVQQVQAMSARHSVLRTVQTRLCAVRIACLWNVAALSR